MQPFRYWIALCMLLFFVPTSPAQDDVAILLRRVPESADALVIVRMQALFQSPRGKQDNWSEGYQLGYLNGAVRIPPTIKTMLIASEIHESSAPTTYGVALLLKIFLALVLAFLGAINRYRLLPGLGSGRSVFGAVIAPGAAVASLSRFVSREALVAVVVFGCTAVLGESTPKSHEGHTSPVADREGSTARVTMEALHASGGVPKDWIFAPPDGDPRKGRVVFERLECFTCHAVAGEKFPRPSRPGPALTDVGRHHPAGYLFESVINPNAVIVEAPGYTGPNGRSIMPDHRDSLSARELIDLVAYLKSLGG